MITTVTRAAFAVGVLFGAAVGVPIGPAIIAQAEAQPTLQEDDPGWSCAASGDRVCGPLSDDWGHAPGCYDKAGALVAVWPCHVVVDPATGEGDVYEGLAR